MAHDATLADRVRDILKPCGPVVERRMMGALCFMIGGHMCCGVAGQALMVRLGTERVSDEPHVHPMAIGGRRTAGFVLVDRAAVKSRSDLKRWVGRGLECVATLPPKGQVVAVSRR